MKCVSLFNERKEAAVKMEMLIKSPVYPPPSSHKKDMSFGCSYLFFTVSALLMSVVEVLLSMWFDCSKMKLIFAFFIGLLQVLGTVCLFRIRRFSRGVKTTKDRKSIPGMRIGAAQIYIK